MPDWVIWVILGFIFFRLRARSYARRRHFGCHGHRDVARGRHWAPTSLPTAAARPARPPLPPESPLDVLKRRFVEGSITVEQYEAELDSLYARTR